MIFQIFWFLKNAGIFFHEKDDVARSPSFLTFVMIKEREKRFWDPLKEKLFGSSNVTRSSYQFWGYTLYLWLGWFERYAGCSSRPKCVLVQVETPEVTGPALRSEFSKISRCSLRRPLFLLTSNLFLLTTKKCFQNLDQYQFRSFHHNLKYNIFPMKLVTMISYKICTIFCVSLNSSILWLDSYLISLNCTIFTYFMILSSRTKIRTKCRTKFALKDVLNSH